MRKSAYPSIEEIRALEFAARRARSREVARLVVAAAAALKSVFHVAAVRVVTHH